MKAKKLIMIKYKIQHLSGNQTDKEGKTLLLRIEINDQNKLEIAYDKDMIKTLKINKNDLHEMINKLEIILDDKMLGAKNIVSLYVQNTFIGIDNSDKDYEVEQELKVISNNKDLSKEMSKNVNQLILNTLFSKLDKDFEDKAKAETDEF